MMRVDVGIVIGHHSPPYLFANLCDAIMSSNDYLTNNYPTA